ncbi:MAG: 2OG-Fe(II) oxygenase [Gammaproteobacteria bacterium]
MQATRRHLIEGREVRIYDGLLAVQDVHSLTSLLEAGGFTRNEYAKPETAAFRHWVLNIPLDAAARLPMYAPTLAAARDWPGGETYRVYRCYCNHAAYGDMLFTHTDCKPGGHDLTALWFVAPEWNPEWGGETLFFDSKMDAAAAVSPRPGRLVVFDGTLTHVGRPPNRICFAPRYTLALKLESSTGTAKS